MDFTFSAEQQDLRAAIRDVARDRCSSAQLRDAIDNHDAYDASLWSLLAAELGLIGVAVSEANGGMGGSFVDAAVAIEEAGAALFPAPLLTAVVAAVVLDRTAAADPSLVAAVATGERTATLVVAPDVATSDGALTGEATHAIDAHLADVLVVAHPEGVDVVTAADVAVVGAPSLDLCRHQATVSFAATPSTARIGDAVASARAVDVLRVALAIEAVGGARHCLESTTDYLKTRVQFGRPIGSFQALQHRMADLVVELEAAASTAYYAAWAVADSPAEVPVVAPLAKAVCTDAAYRIAAETIQLHGGIGFTWEHEAQLYFKRAMASRLLLGEAHVQRQLVAARAGLV